MEWRAFSKAKNYNVISTSMIPRENQLFLTVFNGVPHFYSNNFVYECDKDLNIISTKPITFPFSLKNSETFPVFDHDTPQLFRTHRLSGHHYGVAFDMLYEFLPDRVEKIFQIPQVNKDEVQNNRCACTDDKLYVTNGREVFQVAVQQNKQINCIAQFDQILNEFARCAYRPVRVKGQYMKLHGFGKYLLVRDPNAPHKVWIIHNEQVFELDVDLDYDDIMLDSEENVILYKRPNQVLFLREIELKQLTRGIYIRPEQQEIEKITTYYVVDFDVASQKLEYVVGSTGWSLDPAFIQQLQIHQTVSRVNQLYLTMFDGLAYFYANNHIYVCNQQLHLLETKNVVFPFQLKLNCQNFPVFNHDFVQLFKTHKLHEYYYTNVYNIIYQFSKDNIEQIIEIPNVSEKQVQNNKCVSALGRLFITNGSQLYELIENGNNTQKFKLQFILNTGAANLKLHNLNNQLIIRDPANKNIIYKLGYGNTLRPINTNFTYNDIIIDINSYIIFIRAPNLLIILKYEQELKQSETEFGKEDFKFIYKIDSNGWNISNKLQTLLNVQTIETQNFNIESSIINQTLNLNLSQSDVQYFAYNIEILKCFQQKQKLSTLQQTDLLQYLTISKNYMKIEEFINSQQLQTVHNFGFEQLKEFPKPQLLSYLLQESDNNQILNYMLCFKTNQIRNQAFQIPFELYLTEIQLGGFSFAQFLIEDKELKNYQAQQLLEQAAKSKNYNYFLSIIDSQHFICENMTSTPTQLLIENQFSEDQIVQTAMRFPNAVNCNKETDLMWIAQFYQTIPKQFECQKGKQQKTGATALMYAVSARNNQLVPCLLDEMHYCTDKGDTALSIAVQFNRDVIPLLIPECVHLIAKESIFHYLSYLQLDNKLVVQIFDLCKEQFYWHPQNIKPYIEMSHPISNLPLDVKLWCKKKGKIRLRKFQTYFNQRNCHFHTMFDPCPDRYNEKDTDVFNRNLIDYERMGKLIQRHWQQ